MCPPLIVFMGWLYSLGINNKEKDGKPLFKISWKYGMQPFWKLTSINNTRVYIWSNGYMIDGNFKNKKYSMSSQMLTNLFKIRVEWLIATRKQRKYVHHRCRRGISVSWVTLHSGLRVLSSTRSFISPTEPVRSGPAYCKPQRAFEARGVDTQLQLRRM
jgi:hypothetical protein